MGSKLIGTLNQSVLLPLSHTIPVQDMMTLSIQGLPNSFFLIAIINFVQSNCKSTLMDFLLLNTTSVLSYSYPQSNSYSNKDIIMQCHCLQNSQGFMVQSGDYKWKIFPQDIGAETSTASFIPCYIGKASIKPSQIQRNWKQTPPFDGRNVYIYAL